MIELLPLLTLTTSFTSRIHAFGSMRRVIIPVPLLLSVMTMSSMARGNLRSTLALSPGDLTVFQVASKGDE
ncbi:MAG UNVERIFIED_CONTAM: hypothetical protein LVR29_16930, partial [Microcystis novacekii LVE1205-3]